MPEDEQKSLFGPNGRWLWFAGGVLFVLIGVALAALFNLGKPEEQRNDAIRYALYGMVIGIIINTITFFTLGGSAILFGTGTATSPSHQSIC